MAGQGRSFDAPDETRGAGSGTVDVLNLEGASVARVTFPAGWRWSTDVKPIAGTDLCQASHLGFVVSGRLHVVAGDDEFETGAGGIYRIEPGHDAWTVGDETFVGIEFSSETAKTFAKA